MTTELISSQDAQLLKDDAPIFDLLTAVSDGVILQINVIFWSDSRAQTVVVRPNNGFLWATSHFRGLEQQLKHEVK